MAVSMEYVPVVVFRQHIDAIDDVGRRLLANLGVSDHDVANFVVVRAAGSRSVARRNVSSPHGAAGGR